VCIDGLDVLNLGPGHIISLLIAAGSASSQLLLTVGRHDEKEQEVCVCKCVCVNV